MTTSGKSATPFFSFTAANPRRRSLPDPPAIGQCRLHDWKKSALKWPAKQVLQYLNFTLCSKSRSSLDKDSLNYAMQDSSLSDKVVFWTTLAHAWEIPIIYELLLSQFFICLSSQIWLYKGKYCILIRNVQDFRSILSLLWLKKNRMRIWAFFFKLLFWGAIFKFNYVENYLS